MVVRPDREQNLRHDREQNQHIRSMMYVARVRSASSRAPVSALFVQLHTIPPSEVYRFSGTTCPSATRTYVCGPDRERPFWSYTSSRSFYTLQVPRVIPVPGM